MKAWKNVTSGRKEVALVVRAEQSPNPDSRVTLDREVDAIGMPRLQLDWRLQERDVLSVSALVDAFTREARRLGLGTVEKAEWLDAAPRRWVTDPLISAHPLGGYHHMGTTRMADDANRGVTDGWGRVHGIENLYVAGSSLFPTGGWANPTLTVLALALRTAERMISRQETHRS
jgi:choline dehydrogenase-like flavoprotein